MPTQERVTPVSSLVPSPPLAKPLTAQVPQLSNPHHGRLTASDVLQLQRTIGNQAVQRLLGKGEPASLPLSAAPPSIQRLVYPIGDVATKPSEEGPAQIVRNQTANLGKARSPEDRDIPERRRIGKNEDLSGLGVNESLYIVAHGSGSKVGGMNASSLAKHLIAKNLPPNYTGKIYLVSCHSGEGANDSYAADLFRYFNKQKQGPKPSTIEGLDGLGHVDEQGEIRVMDPAMKPDFTAKNVVFARKRQALIDEIAYKEAHNEITAAEAEKARTEIFENTEDFLQNIQNRYRPRDQRKFEARADNTVQPPGCCFLTTACVEYKGLPDDCEELTVLRHFRDSYLLALPTGPAMVAEYYRIAPSIVRRIWEEEECAAIWEAMFQTVQQCVQLIRAGQNAVAMQQYIAKVLLLKQAYLAET